MNYLEAKGLFSSLGIKLTKTDCGEFRVAFPNNEKSAYYTDDLLDAIGTGKALLDKRARKAKHKG